MKKLPIFLFLFLLSAEALGQTPGEEKASPVVAEAVPARDYGFFIGDLVGVLYRIALPADQFLDERSLPKNGSLEEWLEVKERKIEERVQGEHRVYRLSYVYQVFSAGEEAKSFSIPEIKFSYGPKAKPSSYSSSLPSLPVEISPISSPKDSLKPSIRHVWTSSSAEILRLIGVAILLGSAFSIVFRRGKRLHVRSPFRAASRRLSREADPVAAMIVFRRALNEKAGRPIFPHNLEDLFLTFPRARAYEKEIRDIVSLSEELVFNPRYPLPGNGLNERVRALARELRRAELW